MSDGITHSSKFKTHPFVDFDIRRVSSEPRWDAPRYESETDLEKIKTDIRNNITRIRTRSFITNARKMKMPEIEVYLEKKEKQSNRLRTFFVLTTVFGLTWLSSMYFRQKYDLIEKLKKAKLSKSLSRFRWVMFGLFVSSLAYTSHLTNELNQLSERTMVLLEERYGNELVEQMRVTKF